MKGPTIIRCGDGIVDGIATEREMMTRALWGMGQRESFLHDGRATNVRDAILTHDGEGAGARDAFAALTPDEQQLLLRFLASL